MASAPPSSFLTRRDLLRQSAAGFGLVALTDLLARAEAGSPPGGPDRPGLPHVVPRAKRVIFLFMHGGPSQVDTFDYKPLLERDHGKPLPFPRPRVVSGPTGNLLRSPWKFQRRGQCGAWVSELFPEVAKLVDDLCIIRSMHCSNSRHGGAVLELHTGSDTFVRPSMGSWVNYGLGTENRNLPGFITICPTLMHGGVNNFSSAFLPAVYQGTALGSAGAAADRAKFPFIKNEVPSRLQRLVLDLKGEMDQEHLTASGPDPDLESRIQSFEVAFRMQSAAPEAQDVSAETKETHSLYGLDNPVTHDFGKQCLMARRFAERGVRFVQVTHSYGSNWDQHENLYAHHSRNALQVEKPIAGLLTDLKRRGLLKDTLVLWGGEFGRTPVAQGTDGRDHNPQGFTMWLAGGGVKGGLSYGATDDYGYYAIDKKVHFHDLHATLLHLLGVDHKRLTFRHAGRDFRLTDVAGNVVTDILA